MIAQAYDVVDTRQKNEKNEYIKLGYEMYYTANKSYLIERAQKALSKVKQFVKDDGTPMTDEEVYKYFVIHFKKFTDNIYDRYSCTWNTTTACHIVREDDHYAIGPVIYGRAPKIKGAKAPSKCEQFLMEVTGS